jgi:hypothetical protein
MTYITAKQMYDGAGMYACREALDWLASLPPESNPLDHEHSKKAEWACWYASNILRRRWLEAEPTIAASPIYTYVYAYNIIRGRWLEAEAIIATSAEWAYLYARDIIKGRWLESEAAIMTSPVDAYYYARDVLQRRWLEAEDLIATDSRFWKFYQNNFKIG